jgi:hypothetical protein
VNDVKDLFELALSDTGAPPPDQRPDPAADLARGRRLHRRRRRHQLAGVAGVTAVALGGVLVPLSLSAGTPAPTPHHTAAVAAPSSTGRSGAASPATAPDTLPVQRVALVVWEGTQPPGYRVSFMPKGWVVQGSTPYALTMAPANAKDKDPDSFLGKLVVMLQSRDATAPPSSWAWQPVNGRAGRFDVQDGTQILIFKAAGGQWVDIQAPVSLGWTSAELAKFGGGVQVLGAAQQGRG